MGLNSIWINSLGPDIVRSLWIDVEDVYYTMDTDTNKTGETRIRISTKSTNNLKYTVSFSFIPLGGREAAAYCVDGTCPLGCVSISMGFGLSVCA